MKAKDGALRVDQGYKYVTSVYRGKYSRGADEDSALLAFGEQCQNCGQGIINVCVVRGTEDGREYRIGMDCAAALTTLEPSELEQAKKRMRLLAKMHKFIAEDCRSILLEPYENHPELYCASYYAIDCAGKWRPSWHYRGPAANLQKAIDDARARGIPVYTLHPQPLPA